ncbi:MAG: aminoacyl-tRNA hydrolase [Deltaproteobacteria bacterium]|nr:MAG: aminoacyl-tRNA hydrolase [Deltaproteobacteria bacterium]
MIVGFGNPGKRYRDTRHNLGFKAVDLFCAKLGLHLSDRRFQALSARTTYHDKRLVVSCPQTFMNRSGLAVKQLVEYYRPETKDIMVIHDDLDLDVGRMKIVRGGGAGGHHGLESVFFHLKITEFNRIKIGIGRPRHGESIEDFVLSPPYEDQKEQIKDILHTVVEAIELFVMRDVESVMNTFNSPGMRKKEVEG